MVMGPLVRGILGTYSSYTPTMANQNSLYGQAYLVVRIVQGRSYHEITIRPNDAVVLGNRGTLNLAIYAFLICLRGYIETICTKYIDIYALVRVMFWCHQTLSTIYNIFIFF